MKLVVAPQAAAQLLLRKRWWRANRPKAPSRFDEELANALSNIAERPESFPVFSTKRGVVVRRCLLARTSCHLYFEVAADEVLVLAARGAVQGQPPRLPK
jgi:plasmid stabilization system protein ParE